MTIADVTRPSVTVLSISHDANVLASRNAVLRQAGYNVVTTMKEDASLRLVSEGAYDVVVLGDSIPPHTRERLAGAVRESRPGVPVIVIKLAGESAPDGCLTMDSLDGPEALLRKLQEGLRMGQARAA